MDRILRHALALAHAVIECARIEGDAVVVGARPRKSHALRCPACGGKCACYDGSPSPGRRRAMDLARSECFLEYRPSRVSCPEHGVLVEAVPWARRGSRLTRGFEDWAACLAVRCTASAVAGPARIGWHAAGGICTRVYAGLEAARGCGRFDGVRRIGIDEASCKKGRKCLAVVAGHDRGCLMWAHEGCGREVPGLSFGGLTRERRRAIEAVTADGAKWIRAPARRRCPNARWVMDPFHVVQWMNDAPDGVRREGWQAAKGAARDAMPRRSRPGRPKKGEEAPAEAKAPKEAADSIKGSRFALAKNPESLTDAQRARLESLKRKAGSRLSRAWGPKEGLRAVSRTETAGEAEALPDAWLHDAAYCRIAPVVAVEEKARGRRAGIVAAVEPGIGNGRAEAIDNKVKVTVRMGYGFRNTDDLVSLLMLRCSDCRPRLPGRQAAKKAA
jgi:transposase